VEVGKEAYCEAGVMVEGIHAPPTGLETVEVR
jgi:hypothetical protein